MSSMANIYDNIADYTVQRNLGLIGLTENTGQENDGQIL